MSTLSIINRDDNWSNDELTKKLVERGTKMLFYDRFMLGNNINYNDYFDIVMLQRLSCNCNLDKYKQQVYKKIKEL